MKIKFLDNYALEEKFFIYMLLFSVFIALFSMIGNIIIGFNFIVNYKWIILILISLIALRYSMQKKYVIHFQVIIFSLIVFIFLPSGWITAGGLNEFTATYICLICISICFIFRGKIRLFFVASEILVVLTIIYAEQYYPQFIFRNSQESQFMDRLIQMPLTLFTIAIIITIFSNAYRNEEKILKEYSKQLKEKNKKLLEISRTDDLTGTFNRRYVFEKLSELSVQMKKRNRTVMIIMIDIDNFKYINDNYGHMVGDELLKRISRCIVTIVQEKGFVGRYGGDEFIVVLENVNIKEAEELAKRIMLELGQVHYEDKFIVTVSGGMAQLTANDDIDDVLSDADRLLYKVKHSGKNDILYEDNMEPVIKLTEFKQKGEMIR